MKKLCKFILGCLGLVGVASIPLAIWITNALLVGYISRWFALAFIITFPLSIYMIKVMLSLSCTDKFIEWVFGEELI